MSQQLLLDISNATARSRGQARRRNQPAQNEDARKAQRNLARRERARCKKTGKTEQQLLPSVQPSPYADRLQYGAPLPVKDKATYKLSDPSLLPHIPAFTILPAHAININLRALAQSSRYIVTQSVAQETKDILRGDSQRVEDVSVVQARDGFESRITPEEQNLDAAEILVEVAKGQQPTSHGILTNMSSPNLRVPPQKVFAESREGQAHDDAR
ncbi:MAG: hypothetical protein Q9175_002632 [Cornicularia normoerica]